MTPKNAQNIQAAEILLPCKNFNKTVVFFTNTLGFKLNSVAPAENPSVAVINGYGIKIRLDRENKGDPGSINLLCSNPNVVASGKLRLTAPNGTHINIIKDDPPVDIIKVKQTFVINKISENDQWASGRAGMLYRDLIPGNQGGYIIASHIRIVEGGPVSDFVHYHKILFQMIYCYKGWVRVVYEDQGKPFVINAGDCVLQPPQIRHRVLESSPGAEVIELTCPAHHETRLDHEIKLPTPPINAERLFHGQRFVRHKASKAVWKPWGWDGFEARDIGVFSATNGLVRAHVVRPVNQFYTDFITRGAGLLFTFVLSGSAELKHREINQLVVTGGDSFVVPSASKYCLSKCSEDMELLEVVVPTIFNTDQSSIINE